MARPTPDTRAGSRCDRAGTGASAESGGVGRRSEPRPLRRRPSARRPGLGPAHPLPAPPSQPDSPGASASTRALDSRRRRPRAPSRLAASPTPSRPARPRGPEPRTLPLPTPRASAPCLRARRWHARADRPSLRFGPHPGVSTGDRGRRRSSRWDVCGEERDRSAILPIGVTPPDRRFPQQWVGIKKITSKPLPLVGETLVKRIARLGSRKFDTGHTPTDRVKFQEGRGSAVG